MGSEGPLLTSPGISPGGQNIGQGGGGPPPSVTGSQAAEAGTIRSSHKQMSNGHLMHAGGEAGHRCSESLCRGREGSRQGEDKGCIAGREDSISEDQVVQRIIVSLRE